MHFVMVEARDVPILLRPFGLDLSGPQVEIVVKYLDLLLRWNEKINLTSIHSPKECVTRHFGESLFLATLCAPKPPLLDIGSGAGFPGLALKIAFPGLAVSLLEPVSKKRAFLKEVIRACQFRSVEVRAERFEDLGARQTFMTVTARAVGQLDQLVPMASQALGPGGRICLWLGREQVSKITAAASPFKWDPATSIPLSGERVLLTGIRG